MHFSASTFFTISDLHNFFAGEYISKIFFFLLELHLLMVLFRTNLVSKISIKAPKREPYSMSNLNFLVQIRCKFNAHFGWDKDAMIFIYAFQKYLKI